MTIHASQKDGLTNCAEVAEHVQQELDQCLNSAALRQIRLHLRRCPNCKAYLDSLKKVILLYRTVPSHHARKKAREKLFAVLKLRGA